MDIGREKETIIVEPLEDPFTPAPSEQPTPPRPAEQPLEPEPVEARRLLRDRPLGTAPSRDRSPSLKDASR